MSTQLSVSVVTASFSDLFTHIAIGSDG